MSELDTNAVLISMLEMLKRQIEYTHLIHGWVIAVNETHRTLPLSSISSTFFSTCLISTRSLRISRRKWA
jgi:hypothetical protein